MSEGFVRAAGFYFLQLGFIALMLAAMEGGYRLGRRAAHRIPEKMRGQISVIEGSLIGILALLLGFTLSMAIGRFEVRRQLVLQEANAIGTAYLRTKLLPDPDGADIASLLRRYLDARIACHDAYRNPERATALREDALRIQGQVWAKSAAWCRANPNEIASLISDSLNQAIDLEAARWLSFSTHLPVRVIFLCATVALVACGLVGYGCGFDGNRHWFSVGLLACAITVSLFVIIDIDWPYHGLIRMGQQPMIDLQQKLRASD